MAGLMRCVVEDRSANLLAGFPTVDRAAKFLRWLDARSPNALDDVRVIAYEGDEEMPREINARRLI